MMPIGHAILTWLGNWRSYALPIASRRDAASLGLQLLQPGLILAAPMADDHDINIMPPEFSLQLFQLVGDIIRGLPAGGREAVDMADVRQHLEVLDDMRTKLLMQASEIPKGL